MRARLGPRAAARDDRAQRLTFATRLAARALLRRPRERERAQLEAQRALGRRAVPPGGAAAQTGAPGGGGI